MLLTDSHVFRSFLRNDKDIPSGWTLLTTYHPTPPPPPELKCPYKVCKSLFKSALLCFRLSSFTKLIILGIMVKCSILILGKVT